MKTQKKFEQTGIIVDAANRRIFPGRLVVEDGLISSISEESATSVDPGYICPILGSAHTHIESSMLPPSEFARQAVVHGEGFGVNDPHEIANVLGIRGIEWMIEDGRRVPFQFFWGASSCVPESPLVRACAEVSVEEVKSLLQRPEIYYLSEVMAFPLVLSGEPSFLAKIEAAKAVGKPIDGHAPGLRGTDAARYAAAGITTDHECVSLEEALDKLAVGMKILIREGSAAKNYEALKSLIRTHPDSVMFCSDDIHPNDLIRGHMNSIIRRAIRDGFDPISVIRAASVNIVQHYRLPVGLLQPSDRADFIVINDLESFNVLETYIGGELVAKSGTALINTAHPQPLNKFENYPLSVSDFTIPARSKTARVIEVHDGQLITSQQLLAPKIQGEHVVSDVDRDLLFITVVDRAVPSKPAMGLVRNFGLRQGAIASSVAHDSHHVVAVGVSAEDLSAAVEAVRTHGGGISAVKENEVHVLPLMYAGLMSQLPGEKVAQLYEDLDQFAKDLGSTLTAPFMTLSFLALSVIPSLKLGNLGLVDVDRFELCDLFV